MYSSNDTHHLELRPLNNSLDTSVDNILPFFWTWGVQHIVLMTLGCGLPKTLSNRIFT